MSNNMQIEDAVSSESESSSDDAPHPDAYTGKEEVLVDFEGRTPIDPDCHGISLLLSRLFLKAPINCMQMAELIIGQNYVGSVIGQCDTDDMESDSDDGICESGTVFGVTTAINITAKKEVNCIQQLHTYIMQRAKMHAPDSVLKHFREALTNDQGAVGFLVNERFVNIPAQISVPLLESLHKEIETAKQKKMKYDLAYFLMILKFYRKEARKGHKAEDTYCNAEEEVICTHAVNSFEFSVASECDMGFSGDWLEGDATLTPYRKILLFDANQLPTLIIDIKNFING